MTGPEQPSELEREAKRLGDELVAALAAHEALPYHEGKPCIRERINLMGYLAHRLGVDLEDDTVLAYVILRAGDYATGHRGPDHREHGSQL